jgi:hypothetical protein
MSNTPPADLDVEVGKLLREAVSAAVDKAADTTGRALSITGDHLVKLGG